MLSERLQDAFNKQLTAEFQAAYAYLGMAAHFEAEDLPGFANFFRVQHQEEMQHAMRFFDFLCEVEVKPQPGNLEPPVTTFGKPVEAFRAGLKHEKGVTESIDALMNLATEEKSHAAKIFLQYFVTEQVEEENLFTTYIKKLEMVGDDPRALYMLDQELGQRSLGASE